MKTTKQKSVHQCHCSICQRTPKSGEAQDHQAIKRVATFLHEKGRRQFAGLLALQLGCGGIERVREITGLSRPTIQRGRDELQRKERSSERNRVRKRGAGRKLVEKNDLKS